MRLFITFTKKSLAVTIAAALLILLVLGQLFTIRAADPDGSTNALRLEYIQRLGYQVEETPADVQQIVIPQEFSDVYDKYNALQRQAGFNLAAYKGKKATVYGYALQEDQEILVHLMICEDHIIGGDVSSVRIDGEMRPLCGSEENGKETTWLYKG